jgi:tetratricopeptide (TPR) repeat protein
MTRVAVLACAVVLASTPVFGGPTRKPPTDKYPTEALTTFVEGVIADKKGDLDTAVRRYMDSNRTSPQANTYWNLGELYRRMEKVDRAIEAYEKYLELEPDARDRAAVEKLVAQLSRDATIVFGGEDFDGVILIDGKLAGPSPSVVKLPKGAYFVERLSPTSYSHQLIHARPPANQHVRFSHPRSADDKGNVILAAKPSDLSVSWEQNGIELRIPGRVTLPPGRQTITPKRACSPIVVDVPRAADSVVHVYIEAQPKVTGCIPIAVKVQTLRLGGKP